MNYEGNVIRPPSEADSIILQVTVGCSHNKCIFCGAYKDVRFRIKEDSIIAEDLDFASRYCLRQKRVFLADGDALIIPQARLVSLLKEIKKNLPWVTRISTYGNAKSIGMKSLNDLKELKSLGMARIYMGLESGHDQTLSFIKKHGDSSAMIEAARKVKAAGLFLSVTVLLGIAGTENSREHAVETGRVLTAMSPNQIAALTLMLLPNTSLFEMQENGTFQLPDKTKLLEELLEIVKNIELDRVIFQANHASNYLPIDCRLSRDKKMIIEMIESALKGNISMKPEYLRAL